MAKRQVYSFEEKKYSRKQHCIGDLKPPVSADTGRSAARFFFDEGNGKYLDRRSRIYRHCDGVLRALVWICRVP